MIVLIQANILTVGLDEKNEVLKELPVRLIAMSSASEATRSLKNEKIDSVISRWDLDDMPNGLFLRGLKAVKPKIPTIVFVRPDNPQQEIDARSLGASAVLTEDTSDELFKKTVANILGLAGLVSIKAISPAKGDEHLYDDIYVRSRAGTVHTKP